MRNVGAHTRFNDGGRRLKAASAICLQRWEAIWHSGALTILDRWHIGAMAGYANSQEPRTGRPW